MASATAHYEAARASQRPQSQAPEPDRLQTRRKFAVPAEREDRIRRRLCAVLLLADRVRVAVQFPDAGTEVAVAEVRVNDHDWPVLEVDEGGGIERLGVGVSIVRNS